LIVESFPDLAADAHSENGLFRHIQK